MGSLLTKGPLGPIKPSAATESADFAAINNKTTRESAKAYRKSQSRRALVRWTCFFLIGAASAALYWVIDFLISRIGDTKLSYFRERLEAAEYMQAWGIYLGFMLLLVWSALLLVYWAPMASGGGVPEVISFLNGSRPKGLFDLKTGLAKAVALVLSVSSGLAIG